MSGLNCFVLRNEPWRNRTSNLLIKSFFNHIDFIGFNILRAAFSALFRPFPDSFRQQTGNNVLRFRWFIKDVKEGLTSRRNPLVPEP